MERWLHILVVSGYFWNLRDSAIMLVLNDIFTLLLGMQWNLEASFTLKVIRGFVIWTEFLLSSISSLFHLHRYSYMEMSSSDSTMCSCGMLSGLMPVSFELFVKGTLLLCRRSSDTWGLNTRCKECKGKTELHNIGSSSYRQSSFLCYQVKRSVRQSDN